MWSPWPTVNTIADGTAVKTPGDKVFPYIQETMWTRSSPSQMTELVDAFLDVMEKHKMVVENSGLLSMAALRHLACHGQERGLRPLRRQHGRDHHGLPGPARPDHAGAASSPSPSCSPTVPVSCCSVAEILARAERQRHQAGAQPVRQHQPPERRGAEGHPGGLRPRPQGPHPGGAEPGRLPGPRGGHHRFLSLIRPC